MKKDDNGMLPEYDLTGKKGLRGKYAKAYRAGRSIRIYDGDKLVSEEHFASIDPDVHAHFPDSKSINVALRKVISLVHQRSVK